MTVNRGFKRQGYLSLVLSCVSERPMKNFCSILIAVVILTHFHCSASCLTESLVNAAQTPVTTEPPCHQHTNVPMNHSHAPDETNTPCSQGPLLEAKILFSGKWVQPLMAVLPLAAPVLSLDPSTNRTFSTYTPPYLWSPPMALSVLRI